eukprot:360745-Chlamydomonas_euryale.AAC.4
MSAVVAAKPSGPSLTSLGYSVPLDASAMRPGPERAAIVAFLVQQQAGTQRAHGGHAEGKHGEMNACTHACMYELCFSMHQGFALRCTSAGIKVLQRAVFQHARNQLTSCSACRSLHVYIASDASCSNACAQLGKCGKSAYALLGEHNSACARLGTCALLPQTCRV